MSRRNCITIGRGLTAIAFTAALSVFAATGASAQDVVKVGASSTSVVHAPLTAAMVEPEIFGAHDITLDVTDLRGNSANCITALISESVDVCQVGTPTGTDAIAEGAEIKAIAVLAGPINEIIVSKKAIEASGVSEDAPIEDRIRALKGMRLVSAQPGSAHHTSLVAMLGLVGMTMDDLQYRVLGDTAAMMESIRNDQIDGAMWTVGTLGGVLEDGTAVRWISMARGDVEDLSSLPYVSAYVRTDWIEENPDLAARVHQGYADAVAWIKENPEEASQKIKAEFYPDLDQGLWDDGFNESLNAFFDNAASAKPGWQKFLELQAVNTGKDYTPSSFENAVYEAAQAK